MAKLLKVYLHRELAGNLIQNNSGWLSFQYHQTYLSSDRAMPLSVSLPLISDEFGDKFCRPYFSGLLPDEDIRRRVAQNIGVSAQNPFALLYQIGRDCAGAVTLIPENDENDYHANVGKHPLDASSLEKVLETLSDRPLLAGEKNIKLSLAGAQNKVAVFVEGDDIYLPQGIPTTHIIKPAISWVRESIYNELFCMRLAQRVGFSVANVHVRKASSTPFLMVERYDRDLDESGKVRRLHQEDFCQALGIVPENKYEREGGPNLDRSFSLLKTFSSRPLVDQLQLLRMVIFNYLIANADAHGKNFSLLYQMQNNNVSNQRLSISLSPFYDLLSTGVYPSIDTKMAMKIGGKYKPWEVMFRHWCRLLPDTATAQKQMQIELRELTEKVLNCLDNVKAELINEGADANIYDDIIKIINQRANLISVRLKRGN